MIAVKSVIEPSCTGTRRAVPSRRPCMAWRTSPVDRAAPVDAGMLLTAAARARRRFVWARSRRFWSLVYACTVVISPLRTPKASSSTLTMGTKQLVVHEALETTVCWAGSKVWSFTPMMKVASTLVAGAEMITRRAPPSMWAAALFPSVKMPVLSITTSTPSSDHGSALGSRSANTLISSEPTLMAPSVACTPSNRPRVESKARRWAFVSGGMRSLMATTRRSASDARAARRKLRPIRPNPLMPTRTDMCRPPLYAPLSDQIDKGGCQSPRIVGQPVRARQRGVDPGPARRPEGQPGRVAHHDVHLDAVALQRRQVGGHVVALRLGHLGPEVADIDLAAPRRRQRLPQARDGDDGQDARVEGPRAEDDLVRPGQRLEGGGGWLRVDRHERDPGDPPRLAHRHLALDGPAGGVGLEHHGDGRGRQHGATGLHQAPGLGHGEEEVTGRGGQAGDDQVAEGVALQLPGVEAVLEGRRPDRGGAQGDQALAEVSRRRDPEYLPQPTTPAAVVGHRDDGRDVSAVLAHGSQGRSQSVAAAEGHHPRSSAHRCTSRWCRVGSKPRAAILSASSSASTTERCWPPVQPLATARPDFPSSPWAGRRERNR